MNSLSSQALVMQNAQQAGFYKSPECCALAIVCNYMVLSEEFKPGLQPMEQLWERKRHELSSEGERDTHIKEDNFLVYSDHNCLAIQSMGHKHSYVSDRVIRLMGFVTR